MAAAAPRVTFEVKNGLVIASDAAGRVVGYGDPVDRTFLVPMASPDALAAADAFGTKRFVFQTADAEVAGLTHFVRDRIFPTAEAAPATPDGFEVKTGAAALAALTTHYGDAKTMYARLFSNFFEQAAFTSGKQTEYQDGDVAGVWCRLNNEHVTPIAIFNADGSPAAIARVFIVPGDASAPGCAYFSDEMVMASIDKDSPEHQALLASLLGTAVNLAEAAGITAMLLRAADGREAQYDAAGAITKDVPGVIHGGPGTEFARLHAAAIAVGQAALGFQAASKTALSGLGSAAESHDGDEPTLG